jgi:hypothetical protein
MRCAGGVGGCAGDAGDKLPDVARIHTRPIKLKYFFFLSLNQRIKESKNQEWHTTNKLDI